MAIDSGQLPWPMIVANNHGHWPCPVAKASGHLWPWPVAMATGPGLWPVAVATSHGHKQWPVAMACGRHGQWPWPQAEAYVHGRMKKLPARIQRMKKKSSPDLAHEKNVSAQIQRMKKMFGGRRKKFMRLRKIHARLSKLFTAKVGARKKCKAHGFFVFGQNWAHDKNVRRTEKT